MTIAEQALAVSPPARIAHPLRSADAPAILLVVALAAAAMVWNAYVGLSFTLPLAAILAGPFCCFALSVYYTRLRPERRIAESALYVGLWLFYPAFGAELTYLATAAHFPLQDRAFNAWDRAMGFDWTGWARFVLAHPVLKAVQDAAYSSCFWQPLAAIVVLAVWGPKDRNGEFLTSVMLGLILTIAIYMLVPSIGPADSEGIAATGQIVERLRSGFKGPYNYVGIIAFPSFHTVMAILFTLVHRGNRLAFAGFGLLNLAMLSAVPFQGDHYLCDMIAGAGVAGLAYFAARRLYAAGYNPRKG